MPSSFSDTQDHTPSIHSLDKRTALLEQAYENLSLQMDVMNAHLNRIVIGIFGAIGAAVIKFILEGGLSR